MTIVRIKVTDNEYSLSLKGHSGYAPLGSDIVCASISMLTYALANELHILEHRGKVSIIECNLEEAGEANIRILIHEDISEILEMAENGYKMLAEAYEKNIRVIDQR